MGMQIFTAIGVVLVELLAYQVSMLQIGQDSIIYILYIIVV